MTYMNTVYGVDTTKAVTTEMVRGAVVECFYQAHCEQSELGNVGKNVEKSYCTQIVEKAFAETGSDFNKPTKASIEGVITWLADFSKSFRNQEEIKKHFGEIQGLLALIKE